MGRPKGSKNKDPKILVPTSLLSPEERVTFLACLIVDRIAKYRRNGALVLEKTKVR